MARKEDKLELKRGGTAMEFSDMPIVSKKDTGLVVVLVFLNPELFLLPKPVPFSTLK